MAQSQVLVIGAAVLALALGAASAASSQTPAPAGASPTGLPAVPTTRVLAIGHLTAKWTPQAMRGVMPDEVRATLRLYLDGKIDQWFVRKDQPGVVFILNTADVGEARGTLEQLPLGKAGLMEFDLIPMGPLAPLGILAGPADH